MRRCRSVWTQRKEKNNSDRSNGRSEGVEGWENRRVQEQWVSLVWLAGRELGDILGCITFVNCLKCHTQELGLPPPLRPQEKIPRDSMQSVEWHHYLLIAATSLHGRELNTGKVGAWDCGYWKCLLKNASVPLNRKGNTIVWYLLLLNLSRGCPWWAQNFFQIHYQVENKRSWQVL